MKAILVLEDGRAFHGRSLGASGETLGEVVFNTSLTGYQEILTDPSYRGQIVTMTYPEQGNYGVNDEDGESSGIQVAGFVVRETSPLPSCWRSRGDLDGYLADNGIVGIQGLDTRALVRHIRDKGAMMGAISTETSDTEELVGRVREARPFGDHDYVRDVTCPEPFPWTETVAASFRPDPLAKGADLGQGLRVIAYDFGVKRNLLRSLSALGCEVTVVPALTPASEVLEKNPDGVFFSNGPGDPVRCSYGVEAAREIVASGTPFFGVCLGHQILSLALGARTFKLKFGHRGGNHPVQDVATGQVEITSQNHGYAVDPESLPTDAEMTHRSLYDGTCEGIRHREKPAFSVQYHPEACPGPHDAAPHFLRFVRLMREAG